LPGQQRVIEFGGAIDDLRLIDRYLHSSAALLVTLAASSTAVPAMGKASYIEECEAVRGVRDGQTASEIPLPKRLMITLVICRECGVQVTIEICGIVA
jgi:hypothetical protein